MPKVILSITNIYNIYRLTTKSFLVVLLSLFISASFAGLFVSSAHAETLDYNVNVEPALNVTIPTDTISLLLDPTNKTFSSQELNISVGTNNPYGYRLTMSSTGTSLIHTEDSNYTIPTLPTLDGGYTDESFIADKWGYKKDSSNWNSYTSGVTLLESNTPVNNDNTNLSFGAKIDYAQAPGNYTLVLNFNAVAKVATNDLVITFAGEGVNSVKVCKVAGDCTGDNLVGTVSTSGSSVPGLEDGSTYYLYPTFASNYEFDSWTKTSTAGTISDTSILNPTFIMGNESASITIAGKRNELVNAASLQALTTSQCANTTIGQTASLKDIRDNEYYLIGKLADGKCWLLDNLRLGSASFASGVTTLDSTNTNTTNSIATNTFSGWNTTSGFSSYDTPMLNTASANDTTTSYGSGSGKIGVYYNYCAATMQSYCYADGSGNGNASQDVCPKGWRMPTGGPSGEYQALYTAYSSNATNFRNALSTPLSGYFYDSSAGNQGSVGHFWSSTYYNGGNMYSLYVNSSGVVPQSDYGRLNGFSVRCVLKSGTIADATNMQTVTSNEIANSAEGETTTLKDVRDNQDYTVAKINGNLWMTRNLAIGCNGTGSTYGSSVSSKSLTSADSNVSTTWSTPTAGLSNGNSYDNPYMTCDSTYGAWYNYAAASAGTITGSSNSTDDTYNICPKGWTLPTYSQFTGITSYSSVFSPVTGGFYRNGSINETGYGVWRSATASSTIARYHLRWHNILDTWHANYRYDGFYTRCIHSS